MEREIHIPAKTWTNLYALAPFPSYIAFRIYNDGKQVVRLATQKVEPTDRSDGIPTYVKQFTSIPVDVGAWAYAPQDATIILQWDADRTIIPSVQLEGGNVSALLSILNDMHQTQLGTLRLLEAAFEDSLSSDNQTNGEI